MSSLIALLAIALSVVSRITRGETITCFEGRDCSCSANPPTPNEPCTLRCASEDVCKSRSLGCRAGSACNVECSAKNSCSDGTMINGFSATDVVVLCGGDAACKSGIEIICGSGDCTLNCFGSTSCDSFGEVFTEASKGFSCNGICPVNVPAPFSASPTLSPSRAPTPAPTANPTNAPTRAPTSAPTPAPTANPTDSPTNAPSLAPSLAPSVAPSNSPTNAPSANPTQDPTSDPSIDPTVDPTLDPTSMPSMDPTEFPSQMPSFDPTVSPTPDPSVSPSASPATAMPAMPTHEPSIQATTVLIEHRSQTSEEGPGMSGIMVALLVTALFVLMLACIKCCLCVLRRRRLQQFKGVDSEVAVIADDDDDDDALVRGMYTDGDVETEVVEIIEGATEKSFYTITVHYGARKFKYKMIGDTGHTGDTVNCNWNESTFVALVEAIGKQFELTWGAFLLYETVDGIHIDVEEIDDIIAGFEANGERCMDVFVELGSKTYARKVKRSSIHLEHGETRQYPTPPTVTRDFESDSYELEIPRPDSMDTYNITDS